MIRDPWRTRLIAIYSLGIGLALFALASRGLGTPTFVLLALALVASVVWLLWLAQAWKRLESRTRELETLYAAEQRRAKQLAAMGQVSQRVAAILELDRLFAEVVELIQKTFSYDHVGIFTVDADGGAVTLRASTNPIIQQKDLAVAQGQGIVGWVAQNGESILANDVTKETRYRSEEALVGTRAELAVPLPVEQRIVGVLDVQRNQPDAFTQDDLFVLEILARQIAVAVEDARLYAAQQEEAWTSTALLQVAEAVSSLTTLDEILEAVVRLTPMLVGVDRCTILLWYEDEQEFVTAKGYVRQREAKPIFGALRFQPGEVPLLDELRTRRASIIVERTAPDPLFGEWIPATLVEEFGIGNLLALPLRAQSEVHGAMLVDYMNPQDRFTDRKKTILSGIADQAAMVIANARSHDAQHEEAWVSTALLQVAQAFISSADLHENISKIARLTPLLVGVDRCMIFLREEARGEFVPYEAHGLNKEALQVFLGLRLRTGDVPLLDEMMRRQGSVVVENAAESDLIPQSLRRDFDIQSVLAVPLISKGEILGAFLVDCAQCPTHFPARKIAIVEGIAHQTAVAIENAHLYETVLEQERMTQELRLASEIQASFLPESCPLLPGWEIAADWHAAREVGGDFYDFIPLGRDRLGLVIADVSDKGVPAALFMALSRTLVRANALEIRSPAKVLQHVNDLIMADTRSNMFVTMFYGVLNRRTGNLTYASAGHNPPIWWRHGSASRALGEAATASRVLDEAAIATASRVSGGTASGAIETAESQTTLLAAKGVVLGVAEEIVLEECQVIIEPGDIVVLYTDGVTEPINEQVEEFGEERLMQTIAAGSDKPGIELVHLIHDTVSAFVGDQPQFDDYTLVAIKREGLQR